jgi:hypothetical protein
LPIGHVIVCAASDYVAHYSLMVAIESRCCLTVTNDE